MNFLLALLALMPSASLSSELFKQGVNQLQEEDQESLASYTFERFTEDFGLKYDDPIELDRRRSVFQRNLDTIIQHNKLYFDPSSQVHFQMGVNQFMDRDLETEMPLGYDKSMHSAWQPNTIASTERARRLQNKVQLPTSLTEVVERMKSDPSSIPASVDWRTKPNVVTSIKNQGGCGSCWAFASTTALESHIAIQTGKLFSLSVQELVSCAENPRHCGGTGGCAGSTAEIAYDYVASHGMVDEWQFGYQSYHGEKVSCKIANDTNTDAVSAVSLRGAHSSNVSQKIPGAVASIIGFTSLPTNDYDVLMAAVATLGPVAVSVAASKMGLYKEGIFDDSNSTTRDINHLVVLEGYGTDEKTSQPYWLVRNSWGPKWGENGYIRLKRVDPRTLEDPASDCKMDNTTADGTACTKDEDGNDIVPPPVKVCGTAGILFDSVVPVGGHLL